MRCASESESSSQLDLAGIERRGDPAEIDGVKGADHRAGTAAGRAGRIGCIEEILRLCDYFQPQMFPHRERTADSQVDFLETITGRIVAAAKQGPVVVN